MNIIWEKWTESKEIKNHKGEVEILIAPIIACGIEDFPEKDDICITEFYNYESGGAIFYFIFNKETKEIRNERIR